MPLINCERNLFLTLSEDCVISSATEKTKFATADTNIYVPIITLLTQCNVKLVQQLKSGFKRRINCNKYQSKVTIQEPRSYLDYVTDQSFQGVNICFVLLFENTADRILRMKYYLSTVEIKDYNVRTEGQNFFDQPVKNNLRTYDNIPKITTGQRDNYTTSCY